MQSKNSPVLKLISNFSKIGLGCHKIQGGFEYNTSKKIIFSALDNDITHFDTAPRYGDSEALLGKLLNGIPNISISSKVGLDRLNEPYIGKNLKGLKRVFKSYLKNNSRKVQSVLDKKMQARYFQTIKELTNIALDVPTEVLTEKQIRYSLQTTLRNLNRDFLDIYLLHEPDRFINFDEIIFIFNKLKQEGLIGSFGLGFHRWIDSKQKFINHIVTLSMFHDSMLKNDKSDSNKIVHGALGWYKYRSTREQREFYGSPIAFIRALTKVNQDSLFLVAPSNNRQLHNFCL